MTLLRQYWPFIVFSIVLIAGGGGFVAYQYATHETVEFNYSPAQATHASKGHFGTDFSRVDSQTTLKIPLGEAHEVYAYLRKTYGNNHIGFIKAAFPNLDLQGEQRQDVSDFTDYYFDTAYLDLYKSRNTIRFRHRVNTLDKNDPKNGRELVQIKITPHGHFELRNEIKYKVDENNVAPAQITHGASPVAFIKPDQVKDFSAAIAPIQAQDLRYLVTLHQVRSRAYLDMDGENIISFSVDQIESHALWASARIASVDIGLQETTYTQADPKKRAIMRKIDQLVLDDLRRQFPQLTLNKKDKYELIVSQLSQEIPGFGFLRYIEVI